MSLISHWCFLFAAGITAVGGIAAVGERSRNFVLGFRAPLLQSLIVAQYLPPFASTYTLACCMAICWEILAAATNSIHSPYYERRALVVHHQEG